MTVLAFPVPHPALDRPPVVAGDVMSTAVIHAHPEDDLYEVAADMLHAGIRHVPVLDTSGVVVGIVSDRDVRTVLGEPLEALRRVDPDAEPIPVDRVMTVQPITARAHTPIRQLAHRLVDEKIGAVPVVDELGRLVGIVSWIDLLHHVFAR